VIRRSTQNSQRTQGKFSAAIFAVSAFLFVVGCGKKGPPLPPLVKLPTPPANVAVARRGDTVDLEFTVPQTNTDNTRPANVTRVDVYALTAPAAVTEAELLKSGVRVGSVAVKAPRDPNLTTDPEEPEDQSFEPPEGKGLDQGAVAHVREELAAASALAAAPAPHGAARNPAAAPAETEGQGPLLGPSAASALVRTYIAVPVAKNGRKGRPSARAAVPLMRPPPAPSTPTVTYDEQAVTVAWTAAPLRAQPNQPGVLPSRPLPSASVTTTYQVYETPDVQLTTTPIAEVRFSDSRVEWGILRFYAVRTVQTVDKLAVESEPSAPACVTLVDTFPPAAPKDLKSIGTEGAISLIWEANTEKDLAGYIVLRGQASGGPQPAMTPITPAPIHDTTFRDVVEAGLRYVYEIRAVDMAGNASQSSNRVEEAAR
jgi:hypothetical protein